MSAGSTLSLEACILDRPVINIGFDGREELPYERSARRGLDYIHITKLLALGGVRVARSFDHLAAHINAYLKNPALRPGSKGPFRQTGMWAARWASNQARRRCSIRVVRPWATARGTAPQ